MIHNGIQGLEMTFWALYFHTPIFHSVLLSFLVVVFVVNGFTPQTRLSTSLCRPVRIIDSQEIVSDSPQHGFSPFFSSN